MANSFTRCPHCGQRLTISAAPGASSAGRYQQFATLQNSHRFRSDAAADAPATAPGDWQKVTPVARLTPRDVTTSLYDAGISGLLVGIGTIGVCWWFEWPKIIAPASGFAVTLWRYFGGLSLAKSLLETIETVTHRDINQDGYTGSPEPAPPQTVRAEIKTDSNQWRFVEFNVSPQKLHNLADLVLFGETFAERTATKAGLTQDEFKQLREAFIATNLARWSHPTRKQQGVSLTRGGRAILQAIFDTPLPDDPNSIPDQISPPESTQQHAAGNYQHIGGQK